MANRAAIELATALGVGAISVLGVIEAAGYRGASSYMPLAVTGFAAALSAVWATQSALALSRGTGVRVTLDRGLLLRFAIIVAAVIGYVLAVTYVGFCTATLIMVPGLSFLIGYRNLPVALITSAGFCVVLYGVFRLLLSIPLPPETLLQALGL